MITAACIALSVVIAVAWAAILQGPVEQRRVEQSLVILGADEVRRRLGYPHHTDGRTAEQREHDSEMADFRFVHLEPNEAFIRETDKILNDIEWRRLGGHTPRSALPVGVVEVGPGGAKPAYSFVKHDQGEPVIS